VVYGMSLSTFTVLHVAISLIGIASGAFVLRDMLRSRQAAGLTAVFLLTTAAMSVTGLGYVIGGVSLIVLVPTAMALYRYRLAGPWRGVHAAGATAALYLNVVQALAPPDVVTQLVILAIFVGLGVLAVKRFRPCPRPPVRIRLPAAPV
jgi:hypothetical protein